jgi:hypothetical protein
MTPFPFYFENTPEQIQERLDALGTFEPELPWYWRLTNWIARIGAENQMDFH